MPQLDIPEQSRNAGVFSRGEPDHIAGHEQTVPKRPH